MTAINFITPSASLPALNYTFTRSTRSYNKNKFMHNKLVVESLSSRSLIELRNAAAGEKAGRSRKLLPALAKHPSAHYLADP